MLIKIIFKIDNKFFLEMQISLQNICILTKNQTILVNLFQTILKNFLKLTFIILFYYLIILKLVDLHK